MTGAILVDFRTDVVTKTGRKYVNIVSFDGFSGLVNQDFLEVPSDVMDFVALVRQSGIKQFIGWLAVFLQKIKRMAVVILRVCYYRYM